MSVPNPLPCDETSEIVASSQSTNENVTSDKDDLNPENNNNNNKTENNLENVCKIDEAETAQLSNGTGKRKPEDNSIESYIHDDFPNDLKAMMQPYHCRLCDIKMNSVNSSELHYECKRHIKKINFWLKEWSKRTGEPIRKRLKIEKTIDSGINYFHCDHCNLVLTSIQHAKEHYAGKKHKKMANGPKQIVAKSKIESVPVPQIETPIIIPDEINIQTHGTGKVYKTYCRICNINVTSSVQMQVHLEGNKHGKKLKTLGAPPYAKPGDSILSCYNGNQQQNFNIQNDVSIFRTPSGNYYCKHCNITLESVHIFSQHLKSKNHLKRFNPME